MKRVLAALTAALSAGALITAEAGNGTKKPITMEAYSRDWAQWAGMSPDRIRWTANGKSIYFEWNPERADVSSLYVVDAAGGPPRKVPAHQLARVPQPPPGRGSGAASVSVPNRDGSRVTERDGDIYVLDVAADKITRGTATEAVESAPHGSHDQQKVTFESGRPRPPRPRRTDGQASRSGNSRAMLVKSASAVRSVQLWSMAAAAICASMVVMVTPFTRHLFRISAA